MAIKEHLSVVDIQSLNEEEYTELLSDGMDRTELVGGVDPHLVRISFDHKSPYYQYIMWLNPSDNLKDDALNRLVQEITS